MTSFGQAWNRLPSNGIGDKISGMFKQEVPLKPRIDNAIRGLNKPISKLDNTSNQLNHKDDKLFQKIVDAQKNKDIHTSKILANDLAQIRNTNKMIGNMEL